MNFRALTTILVLALAFATGWGSYAWLRESPRASAAPADDSLLWLRQEFQLPTAKFARIEKMHADYQIVCEEHCRAIRVSRAELKRLRKASASSTAIAGAEARAQQVDRICTSSLESHLREIAAVIDGEEGRRYLAIVLPRISQFDHAAAPGIDLDPSHDGHAHH
jgi:hypothetical protein